MAFGQAMEAEQQVVIVLLQIGPGTGDQCVDVVWIIVERLQHAHLQRQSLLGDGLPGELHDGRYCAVGKLWVQGRQGDLAYTLRRKPLQYLGQGWLTVAHGDFNRPVRPVIDHGRLQATGKHHQRRALVPPDRGIGVGGLLGTLDQYQRHQQAPDGPGQVDHIGVHEKLIEVAANIGYRRGGR